MERREDWDREGPGQRREQQPAGLAVLPGSGMHRGVRAARGGTRLSGLSLHPWARGGPLSSPVMWDVLQQNAKSPLSDCKKSSCCEDEHLNLAAGACFPVTL